MSKVQGSWWSLHFYANWCLWILGLLTFWCCVHSSGKGFGSRSTQVRAGNSGLMSLLGGLQGQISLLGGLLCCPSSEPLQHAVLLHKCAQLNIAKVVCPVGLKHFWKQNSSVILLGFILSQSKWVTVLTIVLQIISINVGKWKQKASTFPIISTMPGTEPWTGSSIFAVTVLREIL